MKLEEERQLLEREERRRKQAWRIIEELELTGRWSLIGKPVIVGAVRLGLVVAPDIDLEVHADSLPITDCFRTVAGIAESTKVVSVTFRNEMETRDKWLYWEIRYQDNSNDLWIIETYVSGAGDPYAHWSEQLARSMRECMTDEHRIAILSIKEGINRDKQAQRIKSLNVYRAVMDDGIRSFDEFMLWSRENGTSEIVHWLPQKESPRSRND